VSREKEDRGGSRWVPAKISEGRLSAGICLPAFQPYRERVATYFSLHRRKDGRDAEKARESLSLSECAINRNG